jgi:putative NADH-flavin reductase
MKIVILGATGATGQHVLEQALAANHEITIVVRDPAKISITNPKLKIVKGSVTSVDELAAAFRGADAVISTLGPRESKDPIVAQAAETVVQAMKQAGVDRVVWLSAAGVGDSKGPITKASFVFGRIFLPLFLKHPYANHDKAEATLRGSGLSWTVVRPVQLVDKSTGKTVTANLGDSKLGGLKISRKDVAAFMLAEITANKHVKAMPMIHA